MDETRPAADDGAPAPGAGIARRFHRAAASYETHAAVQARMAVNLASLAAAAAPRAGRILELGCGTGLFSARLAAGWPAAELVLVDLAPAMVAACARRFAGEPRVACLVADAQALPPLGAPFDLVAANASFQWLADPAAALAGYRDRLAPGGTLAFATFLPGTLGEFEAAFAAAYTDLGLAPRSHVMQFPGMADWEAWLSGWSAVRLEEETIVERVAGARAAFATIRGLGASGAMPAPASRAILAGACRRYDTSGDGATVPMTWRILYGTAHRG